MIQCNFEWFIGKRLKFTYLADKTQLLIGEVVGYEVNDNFTEFTILIDSGDIRYININKWGLTTNLT